MLEGNFLRSIQKKFRFTILEDFYYQKKILKESQNYGRNLEFKFLVGVPKGTLKKVIGGILEEVPGGFPEKSLMNSGEIPQGIPEGTAI